MSPADLPPRTTVPAIENTRPTDGAYVPFIRIAHQAPQPVPEIQIDLAVEVIGHLPLEAKVDDITRRLGRRQQTNRANRSYPPTILELITLVERNPQKPRGKSWEAIMALTLRFDQPTQTFVVEYCVDYCGHDRRTGALDPKRRMVSYRAPEAAVVARADKKLRSLAKFADR